MSGTTPPTIDSRIQAVRQYHIVILILASAALLVACVLEVHDESHISLLGYVMPELCFWRRTLAIDCPGCGLTRCFVSLAHADVAGAWHFHPAGVVLFAAVLLQFPYRGVQLWKLRRGQAAQPDMKSAAIAAVLLVALLIAGWLWRLIR